MLHYPITHRDILEMAPQTVEYLMAGLIWSGRISVTTQVDVQKQHQDEWDNVVRKLGGTSN